MARDFIPAAELSHGLYVDVVAPALGLVAPDVPHAAALVGPGSEVLGFDDVLSTDHDWGARVTVVLPDSVDVDGVSAGLFRTLAVIPAGQPEDSHPEHVVIGDYRGATARLRFTTTNGVLRSVLGIDPTRAMTTSDWLSIPQQRLLELTAGPIWHDDVGFSSARHRFEWYPDDLWRYLLAACWRRIEQEEHLMGRAGHAGDELGSALIAARIARDVVRLCLLMDRHYAPYAKWLGTAFGRLGMEALVGPSLRKAIASPTWQERESHLLAALSACVRRHNELGLTEVIPDDPVAFFDRPFRVVAGRGVADALVAGIADPSVMQLLAAPLVGNVDLVSDNTDLLEAQDLGRRLGSLWSPTSLP